MIKKGINKYFNAARAISSWSFSSVSGIPVVWGYPFSIGIELTSKCNLACPECASGSGIMKRPGGFMPAEIFEKIVSQVGKYTLNTMFYFQGESMLHPHFFEFLGMTGGMGTVISTNGHFINGESAAKLARSVAREIIVSLDGYSQEVYSRYRVGGDVYRVKEGIELLGREISKRKHGPKLVVQVLVNRYNEGEIDEIRRFARLNDAMVVLKSLQIISSEDGIGLLPSGKKFRRYDTVDNRLKRKGRFSNGCFRLWTNPVITWDGSVVPCCFDKNAEYIMGNLGEEPFIDIWRGRRYRDFRRAVLENRAGIDICLNCTTGLPGTLPT
ncbi:MAG: radical SAM/SPASM domain-containing protein [Bacteroidales bacterium]